MTRLEIAAQILAALCANPSVIQPSNQSGFYLANSSPADLAQLAWKMADALRTEASTMLPTTAQPCSHPTYNKKTAHPCSHHTYNKNSEHII